VTKFFVYGTLKRNYGNNIVLGSAKFVGAGTTVSQDFRMLNGGFPMVFTGGNFGIKGEVFEVTDEQTERNLDRLEGVPHLYTRSEVEVRIGDDTEVCTMYVTNPKYAERAAHGWVEPDDNNLLEWK
jgi:gamma-glutamylcyclotransferase (GGCT)/AIG2-like uncharacterized protein YtfP